ncbi:30S ribosomal protein S20 [Chlamydiota bacterium]
MAKEKEEKKKVKRPTALKRDARNDKMRLINKSFKSNVRTTMRSFEEALKSQDKPRIQEALNTVYSVMDKGVKKGVYKANKASRLKARATVKVGA